MATDFTTADMTILKNSKILVNVDEALTDLIVVSYCTETRQFQGVLLDSNKCNLPYGVYSLHPAFTSKTTSEVDDKLHSASQRFAYQETQYAKKTSPKSKLQNKQKMTVRLRPRKVLCSKCKGICNENSENVDVTRKRRLFSSDEYASKKCTNASQLDIKSRFLMGSSLIPKISRLLPNEISNALNGSVKTKQTIPIKKERIKASENNNTDSQSEIKSIQNGTSSVTQELTFVDVSEDFCEVDSGATVGKNEAMKSSTDTLNSIYTNPRTLKICFGEGEGTVLKIPVNVGDYNENSGVSCDLAKPKAINSKAAKKALKRAKRQAKKTVGVQSNSSKYVAALSPRNNVTKISSNTDPFQRKHKHKVKHKKKSKLDKKLFRDENIGKSLEEGRINYFPDIKQHCLKQKLSISLRRLSSNSYERAEQNGSDSVSDEWESDGVPEFPAAGTGGGSGRVVRVSAGDVVWGKVAGFPWWPGRVLNVTAKSKAHVAWYASTTSSLMPSDSLSPFLEDYKIRFNKKKRGPYKEAVKQATLEAKKNESHTEDPLASPTHASLVTLSPRPIDVFS